MIKAMLFAGCLLLPATAIADAPKDQLLANVERELPHYAKDVDASTLRRSQLAAIYSILHGDYSEGEKRGLIKSAIGGRNTLRGLLFN